MNSLFSIGELSKHQGISRQTLIYYDKIGLFRPAYVDPDNGYRYYSSSQLDSLDTILIMKKIGFSLEEIREHMKHYNLERSIAALRKQLSVITQQIETLQLTKSRVEHRCAQMERSLKIRDCGEAVTLEPAKPQFLLVQAVDPPYSLEEVSLATKRCFVRAFKEKLPIFFQSGAIVPLSRIQAGHCIEASHAFLPIEGDSQIPGTIQLPAGHCVATYHVGNYLSIGKAYRRILAYCEENRLKIQSDSYEFAINDYLSTGNEEEYVTKIILYVEK